MACFIGLCQSVFTLAVVVAVYYRASRVLALLLCSRDALADLRSSATVIIQAQATRHCAEVQSLLAPLDTPALACVLLHA